MMEVHFFSSKKVQKDTLHSSFIQHESYSLGTVLDDLRELQSEIQAQLRQTRRLEPNRRGTFILLDLEQAQLVELKNKGRTESLVELIKSLAEYRIYIFLCTASAQDLPGPVLKAFDWACFIGAKNTSFAKAFYSMEEDIFSEKREVIGTLYKKDKTLLTPLHELAFVPSAFKLAQEQYAANEEEAYMRFLESLA